MRKLLDLSGGHLLLDECSVCHLADRAPGDGLLRTRKRLGTRASR
jgi:hypothetical protein